MNNNIPDCRREVHSICRENLRKTVLSENIPILKVNIEYPCICGDEVPFYKKFNDFYKSLSSNYEKYCEKILSRKIENRRKNIDSFRPYGEIMKYFISLNSERYISVVLDITHYDGYFNKCLRISHVWDTQKGIILPVEFFLGKANLNVRKLRREICSLIYERVEKGGEEFHYTEGRIRRFAHRVNPENFFLVDGGIAFWLPVGTIAPESEGFPAYVIKSEYI